MTLTRELLDIYHRLLRAYGPQHWWPGDTPMEVMVGAVLTQAATWTNVEKAITNLKAADAVSADVLRGMPHEDLAKLVYPAGYYNQKSRKLKALAEYLGRRFGDNVEAMALENTDSLRSELTAIYGIGEETADDILLYAVGKPVFVVDAFTRRVFSRLGLAPDKGLYSMYQALFTDNLPRDVDLYGEYHALIVRHGKYVCKKRPLCRSCCLLGVCVTGRSRS